MVERTGTEERARGLAKLQPRGISEYGRGGVGEGYRERGSVPGGPGCQGLARESELHPKSCREPFKE